MITMGLMFVEYIGPGPSILPYKWPPAEGGMGAEVHRLELASEVVDASTEPHC